MQLLTSYYFDICLGVWPEGSASLWLSILRMVTNERVLLLRNSPPTPIALTSHDVSEGPAPKVLEPLLSVRGFQATNILEGDGHRFCKRFPSRIPPDESWTHRSRSRRLDVRWLQRFALRPYNPPSPVPEEQLRKFADYRTNSWSSRFSDARWYAFLLRCAPPEWIFSRAISGRRGRFVKVGSLLLFRLLIVLLLVKVHWYHAISGVFGGIPSKTSCIAWHHLVEPFANIHSSRGQSYIISYRLWNVSFAINSTSCRHYSKLTGFVKHFWHFLPSNCQYIL